MSVISMKQLLEAGVHFGHQTRRWNPKMATYIFAERNGIYIIDLQKTVKKLEEEIKELKDKYIRVVAEYDNFRKRTAKERENIFTDAYISAIKAILPVYDNVERAIAEPCVDEAFKKGVELIMKQFNTVFEKIEVKEVPGVGEQFNPEYHNAVMHIEDENLEENVIVEVFQKGFVIRDRVLRHSMVKVAN